MANSERQNPQSPFHPPLSKGERGGLETVSAQPSSLCERCGEEPAKFSIYSDEIFMVVGERCAEEARRIEALSEANHGTLIVGMMQ